jgi:hypothetical protein
MFAKTPKESGCVVSNKNSDWDIPPRPAPNWKRDLAYGQRGEYMVVRFLDDLQADSFEVKSDRYRNGKMVIEMEQNPRRATDENGERVWKKSGLAVTKAKWWVYVFSIDGQHGSFVVVSVKRLRRFIAKNKKSLQWVDFAKNSDNPARGYLIAPEQVMDLMINSAYDE